MAKETLSQLIGSAVGFANVLSFGAKSYQCCASWASYADFRRHSKKNFSIPSYYIIWQDSQTKRKISGLTYSFWRHYNW